MRACILWFLVMLPIVAVAQEPRRVKPSTEVVITLEFIVDGDSEIFIGKKQVKVDEIPEDGVVAELKTEGNKIKKIVYEEKK